MKYFFKKLNSNTWLQLQEENDYLTPIPGQTDGVYYASAQSPYDEDDSYWPIHDFDSSPYSILSTSDNDPALEGRYDSSYYKTENSFHNTPNMDRKTSGITAPPVRRKTGKDHPDYVDDVFGGGSVFLEAPPPPPPPSRACEPLYAEIIGE